MILGRKQQQGNLNIKSHPPWVPMLEGGGVGVQVPLLQVKGRWERDLRTHF